MCYLSIFSLPFIFKADTIILKTVLICINPDISLNKTLQMLLLWILFLSTAFCSNYSSSCSLYNNVCTRCFCGWEQISVEIWNPQQEESRCETRKVSGSPSQRTPLQDCSDNSEMLTQIISRTRWPPYSSCLLASRAICSWVSLQKSGQLSILSDSFSSGFILTPAASQTAQILTTYQGKVMGAFWCIAFALIWT